MSETILLLATLLFHENPRADLTEHWALATAALLRVEDERWGSDLRSVFQESNQFPWVRKSTVLQCHESWGTLDARYWALAKERSKLIWTSRDRVKHKSACYLRDDTKRKWAQRLPKHKYGRHVFYEC